MYALKAHVSELFSEISPAGHLFYETVDRMASETYDDTVPHIPLTIPGVVTIWEEGN